MDTFLAPWDTFPALLDTILAQDTGHRTQDTGHRNQKVVTEWRRWWMYFVLWIHPVVLEDQSAEDVLFNWEYSYSVILVSLVKTFSFSFCIFSFSSSLSHISSSSSSSYFYYYSSSSSSFSFPSHYASAFPLSLVFAYTFFIASQILLWHLLQLVLWLRFLFNILLHLLVHLWS